MSRKKRKKRVNKANTKAWKQDSSMVRAGQAEQAPMPAPSAKRPEVGKSAVVKVTRTGIMRSDAERQALFYASRRAASTSPPDVRGYIKESVGTWPKRPDPEPQRSQPARSVVVKPASPPAQPVAGKSGRVSFLRTWFAALLGLFLDFPNTVRKRMTRFWREVSGLG